MLITLREMEPFNIPPVNNQEAALFTQHLKGNETFQFDGSQKPKCFMIWDLKYAYPRHSYAHAWLLSTDVDSFLNLCNSGGHSTMEPILKKFIIGRIDIEYGGNVAGTQISARTVLL